MNTVLSVQGASAPVKKKSFFSKFTRLNMLRLARAVIPVAVLMMLFPELAMASAGKGTDLMAKGNDTVKATFGKDSSIVKWVVLAEVLVGAVMYMMTKNVKFPGRLCHHLCIYCCGYDRRWPLTGNKTMSGDENKLKKYRFPETLTNQSRWFGLPLDELIPAAVCIGWGITTSKYLFGIGAAVLVYFGIKKLKKGRGSSWLRDLIYWYMPTALLRGIFHNVPDSCFRQWIK